MSASTTFQPGSGEMAVSADPSGRAERDASCVPSATVGGRSRCSA